ncbi:hypothetical protein LGN17_01920 [Burkholderia sp. AU30280]|uniref:hypothetical protein n=1 Tax=Burkholderia sp. AU30280 TaxID=2879628 RepID=UPI001CF0FCAD|nr:hypothetical protein [Burkholderia sp. AU30280]MCA8271277.1 hypothetical protein [Burkholderia sp. AU30280]
MRPGRPAMASAGRRNGFRAWPLEAGRPVQRNVREDTLDRMPAQAPRRALDLLVCRLEASALSVGLDVAPLYRDDMFVVCGPRHPLPRRADPGADDGTRTQPGRRHNLTNRLQTRRTRAVSLPRAVAPSASLSAS